MKNLKTLVINNEKTIILARFAVLLGVASIVPLIGNQLITGPIVNSLLFIAVATLGIRAGVLISIIPSFVALFSGILAPVMAPMVPFIIAGNILLVLMFNVLNKKNYWLGIILASLVKFLFLFITSNLFFNIIFKKEIAQKILSSMGSIQLITALSGGILAFFIIRIVNNKNN